MTNMPRSGSLVYWRFRGSAPGPWSFGYVTHLSGGLIRMGLWNGDDSRGPVVSPEEIEWKWKR
jgi:hypothetical protein